MSPRTPLATAALNGTSSMESSSAAAVVSRASLVSAGSSATAACPGKCLAIATTPAACRPSIAAVPSADTVAGSAPRLRSESHGFGPRTTSRIGPRVMLTPISPRAAPSSANDCRTASAVHGAVLTEEMIEATDSAQLVVGRHENGSIRVCRESRDGRGYELACFCPDPRVAHPSGQVLLSRLAEEDAPTPLSDERLDLRKVESRDGRKEDTVRKRRASLERIAVHIGILALGSVRRRDSSRRPARGSARAALPPP